MKKIDKKSDLVVKGMNGHALSNGADLGKSRTVVNGV